MGDTDELLQDPSEHGDGDSPLFIAPTLPRYQRYLSTMVHYTRNSEDELRRAAQLMDSPSLRPLFDQLAPRGSSHFRLAEADLEALEVPLENYADEIPSAVVDLRTYWNTVTCARAFEYLGALWALENVARWLKQDAQACLASLRFKDQPLGPRHTRFVATHLAADDDHGALMTTACRQHAPNHGEAIRTGAKRAAALWIAMHLQVLDEDDIKSHGAP